MLNKTMLIGRLGRDPEIKYSKDGLAITTFSIATTLAWKDKNSGEKKETIEWHRIVTFGKLAEFCSQYLSKGKQIYVEGRLHTRSWEQDNITRYITEILASNVQSLSAKDSGNGASDQQASGHKDSDHHADDSNPPPHETFPMTDDIPF